MLPPTDNKDVNPFELRSLREQVYQYLRTEMFNGRIIPGEYIRLNEMSERLGISKTPLRDAIIQLECERFVTILPRRGGVMSRLSLQDVKDAYDVVGALEATVIVDVCSRFTADHLDAMTAINLSMKERQNCREHDEFVELIHTGDGKAAADLLQNRHWSFFDYEGFIRKFYEPLGFEVP